MEEVCIPTLNSTDVLKEYKLRKLIIWVKTCCQLRSARRYKILYSWNINQHHAKQLFFLLGATAPSWPWPPHSQGF